MKKFEVTLSVIIGSVLGFILFCFVVGFTELKKLFRRTGCV